jgi:Double zinc ribbon
MKCPKCQFENPDSSKFCLKCGAKQEIGCPKCGQALPAYARFCNECGYDLTAPAKSRPIDYPQPQTYTPKYLAEKILTTRSSIEGERKLVTVLFADVANYGVCGAGPEPGLEAEHRVQCCSAGGLGSVGLGRLSGYQGSPPLPCHPVPFLYPCRRQAPHRAIRCFPEKAKHQRLRAGWTSLSIGSRGNGQPGKGSPNGRYEMAEEEPPGPDEKEITMPCRGRLCGRPQRSRTACLRRADRCRRGQHLETAVVPYPNQDI